MIDLEPIIKEIERDKKIKELLDEKIKIKKNMEESEILEYLENNYGSTLEDIFYGEYKGESFEFGKSILVNIIKELIESKKD